MEVCRCFGGIGGRVSAFRDIPPAFPLDVPLKSRPAEFQLRVDDAERIATVVLALFWGLSGTGVLWLAADPLSPWEGAEPWLWRAMALAALTLYVIFGIGYWLAPAVASALRRLDVRISDSDVEVVETGILGSRRWSKPIAEYQGVAIENWGTRTVGKDKIPVRAVMLVHEDDRYSVPLVINGAMRVKDNAASRKAEQLGVPVIDAPSSGGHPRDRLPGSVVVNSWQALKVRLLYAALVLAGIGGMIASLHPAGGNGEPAYLLLSVLGLLAAAGMHVYASRYVVGMRVADAAVEIDTATFPSRKHVIPRSDIQSVDYREGRSGAGTRHSVHAPWVKVRVQGFKVPFIIDMQSEFVDEHALRDLARRPG